eukprot:6210176-Pleurochrysis_carterae.AAC.1
MEEEPVAPSDFDISVFTCLANGMHVHVNTKVLHSPPVREALPLRDRAPGDADAECTLMHITQSQ